MDDLLAAAGAENVEYPLKTACCGGAHTLSDSDTSTKLVLNLLTTAEACGADVIATECPTCHTGLEMHQVRAEKVLRPKDLGEDPLLHPASRHGARPVGAQGRRARESFRFLRLAARARPRLMTRRCPSSASTILPRVSTRSSGVAGRRSRGRRAERSRRASWHSARRSWRSGSRRTARHRRRGRSKGFRLLALASPGRAAAMRASTPAARPAASLSITAILFASIPLTPTPRGGCASARWSQGIWRCSSAASSKSRASANFAARRARFASTRQTSQPGMA